MRQKYFDMKDVFSIIDGLIKNKTNEFEMKFAEYIGKKYAVATSFGRTALYAGLKAIDVKGKEIILPNFTCTVVRNAIVAAEGIPVFVNVKWKELCYDTDDLEKKITKNTKAIILTHFFGKVARNIERVLEIGEINDIYIIEDCAHSLGAEYKHKKAGFFGTFSIFSLTKSTINFGGGVLVTDDLQIFKNAKKIIGNDKRKITNRIVDFPLVIAYGMEQIITKLYFDRIKNSAKKWEMINFCELIKKFRYNAVNISKNLLYRKNKNKNKKIEYKRKTTKKQSQIENVFMEPVIAALGINQLSKIDILAEKRRKIFLMLKDIESMHIAQNENENFKDVCTSFLMNVGNYDLDEIKMKAKRKDIFLQGTWPTHQNLWKNQNTSSLDLLKKKILVYMINPDLNIYEIKKLVYAMNKEIIL